MFNYKEILEKSRIILRAISNRGYHAYLTGESVVNAVLGIDSNSVTISTNAPLDEVKMLFYGYEVKTKGDYSLLINYEDVKFTVKHFLKELKDGRLVEGDNLEDDLLASPFTISALAMGLNNKITDVYGGYKDISKKRLVIPKNKKKRLKNSPIIAFNGLDYASSLGFSVASSSAFAIKRSKEVRNISLDKQLDYILSAIKSTHTKSVLKYLKKTRLYKYMPIFGSEFNHQIKKKQKVDGDTFIQMALVRSLNEENITKEDYKKCIGLTKNPDMTNNIVSLAVKVNKGDYKKIDLFNYGLDVSLASNNINYLLGYAPKRTKKIEKEYNDLIIKSNGEIKYFSEEIMHDFRNISLGGIDDLLEKIKESILEGNLMNDYYEIKEFVSKYAYTEEVKIKEEKVESNIVNRSFVRMQEELEQKEAKIRELEASNLLIELDKEAERVARSIVRDLDIYQDEKEKVYKEIKEAYRNILIKNTQKYERLR